MNEMRGFFFFSLSGKLKLDVLTYLKSELRLANSLVTLKRATQNTGMFGIICVQSIVTNTSDSYSDCSSSLDCAEW